MTEKRQLQYSVRLFMGNWGPWEDTDGEALPMYNPCTIRMRIKPKDKKPKYYRRRNALGNEVAAVSRAPVAKGDRDEIDPEVWEPVRVKKWKD
jgi:hypothetical protein